MNINQVTNESDLAIVKDLLREYYQWLEEVHGLVYDPDDVAKELKSLQSEYVSPEGRLIIAYQDELPVGCGSLRAIDNHVCELAFRGKGYGRELVQKLLEEAKGIGYKRVRLCTYSFMYAAQALYSSLGFRVVSPIQNTSEEIQNSTVVMELEF